MFFGFTIGRRHFFLFLICTFNMLEIMQNANEHSLTYEKYVIQVRVKFGANIFVYFCVCMQTLGMARNLRSNRSVAGFFEESDEEELDESFDGSDLEFIEDSDEAPAETLDRYNFVRVFALNQIVCFLYYFLAIMTINLFAFCRRQD